VATYRSYETLNRKQDTMNQIANRATGGAVAALSSLKAGLQNVSSTIHTPGGLPILRLLKDGDWVYGAENVEVEEGSLWAVNLFSIQHGWVAWTDKPGNAPNEIVGEIMVSAGSPLPLESSLADVSDKQAAWRQQLAVELLCVNGTDNGEVVNYKTTSVGGMNAIKTLLAAIQKQLDTDPDRPVPLVALENDSYQHRRHGKVYYPVLAIAKWVELTDEAPTVDEPEPAPEPAKETRQRQSVPQTRRAAPAAEPAEEKAETVEPTAADRKAALLAEIARLEAENAETEEAPEAQAADAPRRRRRA